MIFLFWVSLFAIFYAYFGYPLLLFIISLFYRHESSIGTLRKLPSVSFLISAYNEEKIIGDKIDNSLLIDYPKELVEILVISDGSTDKTEDIVKQYSKKNVFALSYKGRIGKTACLNQALPLARGEIVVFSDANSIYAKDAIKELVRHFSDKKIGFVTGVTKYVSENNADAIGPIDIYSKLEIATKKLESKISSCVGADGAIFAIRKKLFQVLDKADINDLVIPLKVIKQGYKGVLEEKAFCTENSANSQKGEFKRQERIANRTIRAIFRNESMLNPMKFGLFAFQFFSHKVTKCFAPFFLIILLVTNISLFGKEMIYSLLLGAQLMFYFLALLGIRNGFSGHLSKLIFIPHTFASTNVAMLHGWIGYVKGRAYSTWASSRG